jgi:hypothetical protein
MLDCLIEVVLLLKEVSEHSGREKSIPYGDITYLWEGHTDRYTEINGRSGLGGLALTPTVWVKIQRSGKEVNCKLKPDLYLIQHPASKLNSKEELCVVRYVVDEKDWSQAARHKHLEQSGSE